MKALTREILNHFDRLSSTEQLEVGRAILRRLVNFDFLPLTDEDLALNAEELFLALDQQELDQQEMDDE